MTKVSWYYMPLNAKCMRTEQWSFGSPSWQRGERLGFRKNAACWTPETGMLMRQPSATFVVHLLELLSLPLTPFLLLGYDPSSATECQHLTEWVRSIRSDGEGVTSQPWRLFVPEIIKIWNFSSWFLGKQLHSQDLIKSNRSGTRDTIRQFAFLCSKDSSQ